MSYGEQTFAEAPYAAGALAVLGERIEWFAPLSEPVLPAPQGQQAGLAVGALVGDYASQRIEWLVSLSEPVLQTPRYHHEAGGLFDALLGGLSLVVGSATLTITTTAPALLWAPLYGEAEFLVPTKNEYIVR